MNISIRLKLVVTVALGFLAVGAGVGFATSNALERATRDASKGAIESASQSFSNLLADDVSKLSATSEAVLANPELKQAFVARDRPRLLALAAPLFDKLKGRHRITHFYFLTPAPERKCFLRVHSPELFDDTVDRVTLTTAIQNNDLGAGLELGVTAFALRVVRPYYDGAQLVGYLELGEEIDHFLAHMKKQSGDDYALLLDKARLDRKAWAEMRSNSRQRDDWDDLPGLVVANSTSQDALSGRTVSVGALPQSAQLVGEVTRGRSTYARGIFPIHDVTGATVGAVLVDHDITSLHDAMAQAWRHSFELILLLAAIVCGVLIWGINRLVVSRLKRMIAGMEDLSLRLAGGEYTLGEQPKPSANDEIGRFEEFFGRFIGLIASTLQALSAKAKGAGQGGNSATGS